MKASEQNIDELLEAYSSGAATPDEEKALFDWVAGHPDSPVLKLHIRRMITAHQEGTAPEADWEGLYRRIVGAAGIPEKRNFRVRKLAIAASVAVLVAAAGLYFLSSRHPRDVATLPSKSLMADDVAPGTEKAVLRAAGASVVLHRSDTSFVLAGNTVHVSGAGIRIAEATPVTYTLEVPRGGDYSLTLADGSKVWLNAASTLRYPSVFSGADREVWLEGEAYFQVHGTAEHPFVVHTPRQRVEVLGTEFNIRAYQDDRQSVTTLLRGKVSVESAGQALLLAPGEQALSGDESSPALNPSADIAEATAWKDGFFRFDKADIHAIMQQLARWYNVEVSYAPGLDNHLFGALISRDNNISEVLNMLEQTGDIHFQITGRKVEVLP
jgi:ferric-dicitrate binding protein FerR (iron transport regulator)